MAWLKLEDSFRDHRKPKRMARLLGVRAAEARGLIVALWAWALTQAPDGDLGDLTPDEIEEAMDWQGAEGCAFKAAVEVGLIDTDPCQKIHEWMDRAGSYREAQRVAKHRKKKEKKRRKTQRNGNVTVHNTDASCNVERRGEERTGEEKRGSTALALTGSKAVALNNRSEILSVFEHYRTYHARAARNPNSSQKTWKLIRDRLTKDKRSVDELKRAIDGLHMDPWPGRENHLDLKYAVKDDDAVVRFIEIADKGPQPKQAVTRAGRELQAIMKTDMNMFKGIYDEPSKDT